MPALNFQKQFAPLVKSGKKRCTFRALRKRLFVAGDTLYLYYGMRTTHCKKLRTEKCIEAQFVSIHKEGIDLLVAMPIDPPKKIKMGKKAKIAFQFKSIWRFPISDCNTLAVQDGFKDYDEMKEWFLKTHGLPFIGQKINW